VVRAPANSYHAINWLFDQGAGGVLVPMINSVEDSRRAVEAAKYPPVGRRSFGPFRAARYGTDLEQYMDSAAASATLILQIEDAEVARGIDAILRIQGIDAVFMGPNDVAFSMLKAGETMRGDPTQWSAFARTPAVIELCEHVMARCRAVGMPFGMTAGSIAEARSWLERGASFVTAGSDASFMRAGAREAFDGKS
jgi:2-keto-3-deoxy-L-rhamnonate aldolase RhmA